MLITAVKSSIRRISYVLLSAVIIAVMMVGASLRVSSRASTVSADTLACHVYGDTTTSSITVSPWPSRGTTVTVRATCQNPNSNTWHVAVTGYATLNGSKKNMLGGQSIPVAPGATGKFNFIVNIPTGPRNTLEVDVTDYQNGVWLQGNSWSY